MKNVNREELSKLRDEIINAMDYCDKLDMCINHIRDFIDEADMNDEYLPDELKNCDPIFDNYFLFLDLERALGAIEETIIHAEEAEDKVDAKIHR